MGKTFIASSQRPSPRPPAPRPPAPPRRCPSPLAQAAPALRARAGRRPRRTTSCPPSPPVSAFHVAPALGLCLTKAPHVPSPAACFPAPPPAQPAAGPPPPPPCPAGSGGGVPAGPNAHKLSRFSYGPSSPCSPVSPPAALLPPRVAQSLVLARRGGAATCLRRTCLPKAAPPCPPPHHPPNPTPLPAALPACGRGVAHRPDQPLWRLVPALALPGGAAEAVSGKERPAAGRRRALAHGCPPMCEPARG